MDAEVIQQQAMAWIVIKEEDWPSVNDCGAIFVPDREMRFEVGDEEWLASNNC